MSLVACLAIATGVHAETQNFVVIANGEKVGTVIADVDGRAIAIDHDVKNNGRGPTLKERIVLDDRGFPQSWSIDGTGTFLNEVHERFARKGARLSWTDSTGSGSMTSNDPILYVAQEDSAWSLGLYARVLLADADGTVPLAPGGTLSIEQEEPVTLGDVRYDAYLVKGLGLSPSAILLDQSGSLIASYSTRGATVREDLAGEAGNLTAIAAKREADRFGALQEKLTHSFEQPVRIRNVRVFDPVAKSLSELVSVVFFQDHIAAIEPSDSPATDGEVLIEGKGGTLLPGLHDMHAHVSLQSSLLYIASGVTSVRDMGNENAVLLDLARRIDAGELVGPRIVRNGFVEGRSEYSSRNGFIVDSEAAALDAVRWYSARGYFQIKIYNSMHPEWVPAIVAEAKRLGMGVTGHIPAFTDADAMIAAGYDEITHINQLMLGWVLEPGEDTRTPLRLTAMQRTAGLDLGSPRVSKTLDSMVAKDIAIDPTAVTLELLMLSRDGQIAPATKGYYDHLPVGLQRRRKQGIARIDDPAVDDAYKGAFVTITKLLRDVHERGLTLLPGTDDGTGLSVHRELQIYAEAGIPAGDVLAMGTLGPEQYMGRDQSLGSIEKGKLADFVLIEGNPLTDMSALHRMAMVVKGGTVYFPAEIWREVGVKPFAAPPEITLPSMPTDSERKLVVTAEHYHPDLAF